MQHYIYFGFIHSYVPNMKGDIYMRYMSLYANTQARQAIINYFFFLGWIVQYHNTHCIFPNLSACSDVLNMQRNEGRAL